MLSDEEKRKIVAEARPLPVPAGRPLRGAHDRPGGARLGDRRGPSPRRPRGRHIREAAESVATFYELVYRRPVGKHVILRLRLA